MYPLQGGKGKRDSLLKLSDTSVSVRELCFTLPAYGAIGWVCTVKATIFVAICLIRKINTVEKLVKF